MGAKYFGASVLRREDPRLLTGNGRYVDDIKLPGLLHAAFLRSPHGHARITSINPETARQMPGVHAVYTHADLAIRSRSRQTRCWARPRARARRGPASPARTPKTTPSTSTSAASRRTAWSPCP